MRNDASILGDGLVFYHLSKGTEVTQLSTELGGMVSCMDDGFLKRSISYTDTTSTEHGDQTVATSRMRNRGFVANSVTVR